ncbi:MAG: HAD family hydrolase [Chloroflexales bacterium]|nr:HAD family hydrolase [Chloroflexales bacterium]
MNQRKQIKAIAFDGDMTLWDFEKVMRHALALSLAELRRRIPGRSASDLTIDKLIAIRDTVAAEFKGKRVQLEDIRLHAFKRTLEYAGCPDDALAADLNALYLKHRFEDIELYPDVLPCLDDFRADYTLGFISNGNGYPERCGLPDRFSFVMLSQDVGIEKPAAGIFLAACQQAGCALCELMHVGDSLASDVAGANRVGAISVWLNRNGVSNTSNIAPNYAIRSLTELDRIVSKHRESPDKPEASGD